MKTDHLTSMVKKDVKMKWHFQTGKLVQGKSRAHGWDDAYANESIFILDCKAQSRTFARIKPTC